MILGLDNKQVVPDIRLAVAGPEQHKTILTSAIKNNKALYIPPRPGEIRRTLADNSKASKLLGWKPTVSFEEGLRTL